MIKKKDAEIIANYAKYLKEILIEHSDLESASAVVTIENRYRGIEVNLAHEIVMGVDQDILNGTGSWVIMKGDEFIASGVINEPMTKIKFRARILRIAELFNVDKIIKEDENK